MLGKAYALSWYKWEKKSLNKENMLPRVEQTENFITPTFYVFIIYFMKSFIYYFYISLFFPHNFIHPI